MVFECVNKKKNGSEKWQGRITSFKSYGTHYEFRIESRSEILVLFGKTVQGAFACMPDYGAGCHLVNRKFHLFIFEKFFWFNLKINNKALKPQQV